MEKSSSFYCKENGSNKEYHIQVVKSGDGYVINFQYGAIGSTLKPGTKTPKPVSEAEADKLYDKLVKERLAKGYTMDAKSKDSGFSGPVVTEKKTHGVFPQLLNSIDESDVMNYINDDAYIAQEKKDGQRRMILANPSKSAFIGLNKKGQEVSLVDSIKESIKKCGVIDGEIIGEILHVFDLLEDEKDDFKGEPLSKRLKALEKCKFGKNISVVKTAYTKAEKLKLYNDLKAANAEGIVFKRKDSKYTPGRPNSGGPHLKHKFYKEASFIVKDFTKGKRSVGLELLNEDGERVFVGKCTIPPNKEVPGIGSVVEVRYLYAYKGGAIFQPTYKEQRDDVDAEECLMAQLIYKEGTEEEED